MRLTLEGDNCQIFYGQLAELGILNLNDIAGARVVCKCLAQTQFLKGNLILDFLVASKGCRVEGSILEVSEVTGYREIYCHLTIPLNGLSEGVKAELQIRTEIQDAWTGLAHYLTYKNYPLLQSEDHRKSILLGMMPLISDSLHASDKMLDAIRREVKRITPRFE